MSQKVRHIDFYPDEYVAGVSGRLSAVDQGVYWMVCALVYSHGGPIDDDHVWLSRLFADTHWRTIRSSLDRLISSGKIDRIKAAEGSQIVVKRCARELQKALTRTAKAVQNGSKGGRPRKENKDLPEPEGFSGEKLTTNHQPTNHQPKKKEEAKASSKEGGSDQDFEEFYRAYPRHVGKGAARKAYATAIKKISAGELLTAAGRFAADVTGKDPKFIPHPATWLNGERWGDDPAPAMEQAPDDDWVRREAQIYAGVL